MTTALCSPSRASTLTGTYAHRHGVLDNKTALPADPPTFPQALQSAGYRTGFCGKWHMGGDSDAPQPGFDHWVSFRGQGVYENPTLISTASLGRWRGMSPICLRSRPWIS